MTTRNKADKAPETDFGFGEVLKRAAAGAWLARRAWDGATVITAHQGRFMSVQGDGDVIGFVYINDVDQFAEDWYEVDKPE